MGRHGCTLNRLHFPDRGLRIALDGAGINLNLTANGILFAIGAGLEIKCRSTSGKLAGRGLVGRLVLPHLPVALFELLDLFLLFFAQRLATARVVLGLAFAIVGLLIVVGLGLRGGCGLLGIMPGRCVDGLSRQLDNHLGPVTGSRLCVGFWMDR